MKLDWTREKMTDGEGKPCDFWQANLSVIKGSAWQLAFHEDGNVLYMMTEGIMEEWVLEPYFDLSEQLGECERLALTYVREAFGELIRAYEGSI